VDEPCDLPEGTEIDLVAEEANEEPERIVARLRASPPAEDPLSVEEAQELAAIHARGRFIPHEEVRRKVAAKKA
jgi:hypothetical protein